MSYQNWSGMVQQMKKYIVQINKEPKVKRVKKNNEDELPKAKEPFSVHEKWKKSSQFKYKNIVLQYFKQG